MFKIKREQLIKEIAHEAGARIKKQLYDNYDVDIKNNVASDLVTSVDVSTEKFIVEQVKKYFPEDSFLTEEDSIAYHESEYTWIIDPIDGTMNFVYFKRDFAISLAIFRNNQPYIGLVYDVMNDEVFYAKVGEKVTLNDKVIKITPETSLNNAIIDISFNSVKRFQRDYYADFSDITEKTLSQRNLGSAALRTVHTALGRVHAYLSSHLHIWDIAAGITILEALGGSYSLVTQENLLMTKKEIQFIAAQSEELLAEIEETFFKER